MRRAYLSPVSRASRRLLAMLLCAQLFGCRAADLPVEVEEPAEATSDDLIVAVLAKSADEVIEVMSGPADTPLRVPRRDGELLTVFRVNAASLADQNGAPLSADVLKNAAVVSADSPPPVDSCGQCTFPPFEGAPDTQRIAPGDVCPPPAFSYLASYSSVGAELTEVVLEEADVTKIRLQVRIVFPGECTCRTPEREMPPDMQVCLLGENLVDQIQPVASAIADDNLTLALSGSHAAVIDGNERRVVAPDPPLREIIDVEAIPGQRRFLVAARTIGEATDFRLIDDRARATFFEGLPADLRADRITSIPSEDLVVVSGLRVQEQLAAPASFACTFDQAGGSTCTERVVRAGCEYSAQRLALRAVSKLDGIGFVGVSEKLDLIYRTADSPQWQCGASADPFPIAVGNAVLTAFDVESALAVGRRLFVCGERSVLSAEIPFFANDGDISALAPMFERIHTSSTTCRFLVRATENRVMAVFDREEGEAVIFDAAGSVLETRTVRQQFPTVEGRLGEVSSHGDSLLVRTAIGELHARLGAGAIEPVATLARPERAPVRALAEDGRGGVVVFYGNRPPERVRASATGGCDALTVDVIPIANLPTSTDAIALAATRDLEAEDRYHVVGAGWVRTYDLAAGTFSQQELRGLGSRELVVQLEHLTAESQVARTSDNRVGILQDGGFALASEPHISMSLRDGQGWLVSDTGEPSRIHVDAASGSIVVEPGAPEADFLPRHIEMVCPSSFFATGSKDMQPSFGRLDLDAQGRLQTDFSEELVGADLARRPAPLVGGPATAPLSVAPASPRGSARVFGLSRPTVLPFTTPFEIAGAGPIVVGGEHGRRSVLIRR